MKQSRHTDDLPATDLSKSLKVGKDILEIIKMINDQ